MHTLHGMALHGRAPTRASETDVSRGHYDRFPFYTTCPESHADLCNITYADQPFTDVRIAPSVLDSHLRRVLHRQLPYA